MRWLMVALWLLLAGCATQSRFEAAMNGYVGRPEAELRKGMGAPESVATAADGSRRLRYSRERSVQYGGLPRAEAKAPGADAPAHDGYLSGTYNPAGMAARAASAPPARDDATPCGVEFALDAGGTVRSWTATSGACRSK